MTGHLLGAAAGIEAVFTVSRFATSRAADGQFVPRRPALRSRLRPERGAPDENPRRTVEFVRLRRHERDDRLPRARRVTPWRSSCRSTAARRSADRAHPECRKRVARLPDGHQVVVVAVGDVGRDEPPARAGEGAGAQSGSARARRGRGDRRAGDDRLLAIALRESGCRRAATPAPGAHPDRQRAHEGAHHRDRRASASAQTSPRDDPRRRRIPGRRRGRQHHDARARRLRHVGCRSGRRAEGRRVPDLHRRRRRLHDRPAHRARGAKARPHRVRRDARAREPRRQGAADPFGRVRREVQVRLGCSRRSTDADEMSHRAR